MTEAEQAELTELLEVLRDLHGRIRDAVVASCEGQDLEELSRVAGDDEGDTIYAIDRVSEELLVEELERYAQGRATPILLIAEGVAGGSLMLPRGAPIESAGWRVIVDPIDGTRGLMYQKRSGWILTGVAPNRGAETSLRDIVLALQSEIPLVKQHLCDQLWWSKGQPVQAERVNRLDGTAKVLRVSPTRASTIAHGYAMISRFFPGFRDVLAAVDDEIAEAALGPPVRGKARCFEDQYVCSGGQLYELMAGRDRFVADLRPLLEPLYQREGKSMGVCCHPYDVCTLAIAEALGVIVTDLEGKPLDVPLDIHSDVSWAGYANPEIRAQVEPPLRKALKKRGLL